eukprot:4059718-Prymnesium_polylepis.1
MTGFAALGRAVHGHVWLWHVAGEGADEEDATATTLSHGLTELLRQHRRCDTLQRNGEGEA